MEDVAVSLRDVEKTYRSAKKPVKALKGVNLTINKGEIFGVLGACRDCVVSD